MKGKLVAIEGIDRAGKSSVFSALPPLLTDCRVGLAFCSEKASPLGFLLANEALTDMSPLLKTYLFAADRAWTYETHCLPALRLGRLVVWERYVDSALIYRRAESRLRPSEVDYELVEAINRPFLRPNLTIVVDVAPETSIARSAASAEVCVYGLDFLRIAREEYLASSQCIVSGERPILEVATDVATVIRTNLRELFA